MIATPLLVRCDNEPIHTFGSAQEQMQTTDVKQIGLAAEGLLVWVLPAPFSVRGKHKANVEAALCRFQEGLPCALSQVCNYGGPACSASRQT